MSGKKIFIGILTVLISLEASFLLIKCSKEKVDIQKTKQSEVTKEKAQQIMVTFVVGKAFLKTSGAAEWESLKVGTYLSAKDQIRTTMNAKVKLQSETGSVISMKEMTVLEIASIINISTNKENTEVMLDGKAVFSPREMKKDSKYVVKTPCMVAGVRGTTFSVEYRNGKSKVSVENGKVSIKPAIKNETVSQKIKEVEVVQGQKTEISQKVVDRINKKIEENPAIVKELVKEETIDLNSEKIQEEIFEKEVKPIAEVKTLNREEKKLIQEEAKNNNKIDVEFKKAEPEGISQTSDIKPEKKEEVHNAVVTVKSKGFEIFIDHNKMADDYYSSIYPQNKELKIEIKKHNKLILEKKIVVPQNKEGIEVDLTPVEEKKGPVIIPQKVVITKEQQEDKNFILLGKIDKNNLSHTVKKGDKYILAVDRNINFYSADKKTQLLKSLNFHPIVKPYVSEKFIFTFNDKDSIEIYNSSGEKIGGVYAGKVIFPTSFTFYKDRVYIATMDGNILGVSSEGKSIFKTSLKDAFMNPVSILNDILVVPSAYRVYVINNGKVTDFRIKNKKERVFYKIGLTTDKMIIPHKNNEITVRDFKGKVLSTIKTKVGDIEVFSDEIFAVKTGSNTLIMNMKGKIIKELKTSNILIQPNEYIIYPSAQFLVFDNLKTETKTHYPSPIRFISGDDKIIVVCMNGNIYEHKK